MSKFTEGKWEMKSWTEELPREYAPEYAVCVGDKWVADCFESADNARLIASAPEMYRMVKYLLGYVREWEAISTGTKYKAKVREDIHKAEALVARIDGTEETE